MVEEGEGESYGIELLTCGIWHYLPIDTIRNELNCRTPTCRCEELLVVAGKASPTFGDQKQGILCGGKRDTRDKERHDREELGFPLHRKMEN